MEPVAKYRLHAEECRALAAQARTPEDKHALDAMAREWEGIASQGEARLLEQRDDADGEPMLSDAGQ